MKVRSTVSLLAALGVAAIGAQAQQQRVPPVAQTTLEMKPTGATEAKLGYFPVRLKLETTKPAGITKEPTYAGTPQYALVKIGSSTKANHVVALDEPKDGEFKVYFDANGNGDLTDDGDGKWVKKNDANGRTVYGVNSFVAKATYSGRNGAETTADYGIGIYRIVTPTASLLLCYREAARVGELKLGEKTYKATLVENDADGLFNKRIDDEGKPTGNNANPEARPVWLVLTADGGKPITIDARGPFELDGKVYEARISPNGERLSLTNSTRKPFVPKAPERPALLASGTVAPDFTAYNLDGTPVKLSDLKGKTVILDFWATWCGPCMKSMPHIEQVYQATKDKNVVVLAVCVWDEKAAFEEWVPKNKAKYTFPLVFDKAGSDNPKSIASALYKVSGIPTTYIIDKDGKVVESVVGYDDNDKRVEEALKKAGVAL